MKLKKKKFQFFLLFLLSPLLLLLVSLFVLNVNVNVYLMIRMERESHVITHMKWPKIVKQAYLGRFCKVILPKVIRNDMCFCNQYNEFIVYMGNTEKVGKQKNTFEIIFVPFGVGLRCHTNGQKEVREKSICSNEIPSHFSCDYQFVNLVRFADFDKSKYLIKRSFIVLSHCTRSYVSNHSIKTLLVRTGEIHSYFKTKTLLSSRVLFAFALQFQNKWRLTSSQFGCKKIL